MKKYVNIWRNDVKNLFSMVARLCNVTPCAEVHDIIIPSDLFLSWSLYIVRSFISVCKISRIYWSFLVDLCHPRRSGYGLTICLWLGPPWFNYWFSFTLAYSRISHEYSSLFIIVINLIFMFSLWCTDWIESLYANRIFMYFYIKSSIGTQGEVS